MADLYVCPLCGGIEDHHQPPCRGPCGIRGCFQDEMTLGARICRRHARAAWVQVCEIVSACVLAACVEDYAEARAADECTGVPFGVGDPDVRAARDALCGGRGRSA